MLSEESTVITTRFQLPRRSISIASSFKSLNNNDCLVNIFSYIFY